MAKSRKTWVYVLPKSAKPTAPAALQIKVEAKAREVVESVLKPLHVKPPPDDERFNYIVDTGTKQRCADCVD